MAHLWALRGPNPDDPIHLYIDTDDSNMILELRQVPWRAGDFAIKSLIASWNEYAPEGSPKNILDFVEYIDTTYGTQVYAVVQQW